MVLNESQGQLYLNLCLLLYMGAKLGLPFKENSTYEVCLVLSCADRVAGIGI
jgi:hypothetical protein